MHASPADPTPPMRGRAQRAEPIRARLETGAPGRRILARAASAIATSRELEVRVRQLEAQLRTTDGRATMIAEATRATPEARRSAHAGACNDLVAAVSYDLRTPLQAILGYAELLTEGATTEFTETREFARRIVISSLSLAKVVENLIELSAAQLGRVHLDIEPFDMKRLVADVVRLAGPLARHKRIVLRTDLVPLETTSDRRRIRQIVTNLVEHGITRTESGEVIVSLAAIGAAGDAPARGMGRDSGHDIDAADLPHVFEPFWQETGPVQTSTHATGLGLCTVRHLARLLGGDVRAEAAPGGGNTFTVELPCVAPANESAAD